NTISHVLCMSVLLLTSHYTMFYYLLSYSLLMVVVWSVVLGGLYYAFRRYTRGAWIIALAVLSHWVLDFIVHRPDLPLWPGGPRVGLGLWNSWAGSISVELLIFGAGLWAYLDFTRARDSVGGYAFWALMALLFFGLVSTLFAAAPPSATAMAWGAMTMWLTVPWAWWADAHRETLTGSALVSAL